LTQNSRQLFRMNIRTCYRLDGHVGKSLGWMSQELEAIFRELGLVQYLHVFVEQGFDTWDTILDITESDLWVPSASAIEEITNSRSAAMPWV